MSDLFNECSMCHHKGLRPGILDTRHGDYGVRLVLSSKKELPLNKYGLCEECAQLVESSIANEPSRSHEA